MYTKFSIEEIKDKLKECLSYERYIHSLGTMEKAMELVRAAGYPDEWHYNAVRAPWAIQEAKEKLEL